MEGDAMKLTKKSCWLFLCLAVVTVLAVSSVNQAISANAGETGTQVQTQGDKQGQTGQTPPIPKKDPDVIFYYALILALFIAIPTILDVILAYRSRNKNWQILIEKASLNGLDKDEFQGLIKATSGGPPGIAGMSRSLMAFAVIIILGIAMFHLLTFCKDPESIKIISNVLSMLGATLASITGFYFGGRSAEEKGKAKEEPRAKGGAGGAGAGEAGGAGAGSAGGAAAGGAAGGAGAEGESNPETGEAP
jgi:hypothetical protein